MSSDVTIQTRGYLWIMRLVAAGLGTAALFAALDLDDSTPTALSLLAGVYVIAAAALVWRARRCSLTLTDDELVVKNLVRTYRLPRSSVTAVAPVTYTGSLNSYGLNDYMTTVRVSTPDQDVTAYGLITMPDRAQHIAGRLRASLGIEGPG